MGSLDHSHATFSRFFYRGHVGIVHWSTHAKFEVRSLKLKPFRDIVNVIVSMVHTDKSAHSRLLSV